MLNWLANLKQFIYLLPLVACLIGCNRQVLTARTADSGKPGVLRLVGSSPDFGDVAMGSQTSLSVAITNSSDWNATWIAMKNLNEPFGFVGGQFPGTNGTCSHSLGSGASCTLNISFQPTKAGEATSILTLTFQYGNGSTGEANLTLRGIGALPNSTTGKLIFLDGGLIDYGSRGIGSIISKSIILFNYGETAATGIQIDNVLAPFALSATDCTDALKSSEYCTLTYTFSPSLLVASTAAVGVHYGNASASGQQVTLNIKGTATPASGTLDASLAGVGKFLLSSRYTTQIGMPTYNESGATLNLLSDGKMVSGGTAQWGPSQSVFLIAKLLADGSPDNTFGYMGRLITSFANGKDTLVATNTQSDGTITAIGSAGIGGTLQVGVARYTGSGMPDSSFGAGAGRVSIPFYVDSLGLPLNYNSIVAAGVVRADKRILAVGYSDSIQAQQAMFAMQLTASGSLDSSFGTNGRVVVSEMTAPSAVALQSDGKAIVVGRVGNGTAANWSIVRLNADGSVDPSFFRLQNGRDFSSAEDIAQAVTIQKDGRIVVVGQAKSSSSIDVGVARYLTDGTPDLSFNGTGKLQFNPNAGLGCAAIARDVRVDEDLRIVLTGESGCTPGTLLLTRILPNGTIDPSFATNGSLQTVFAGATLPVGRAIASTPDGRIVVAGSATTGSISDFLFMRVFR